MSVYVIANYTVHDQEKYEKYPQAVRATVQQYGGKYLVRDGNAKAKGCPHKRLVVIEFESEEAAWRWYESPEYSAIKHYREEASEVWGGNGSRVCDDRRLMLFPRGDRVGRSHETVRTVKAHQRPCKWGHILNSD